VGRVSERIARACRERNVGRKDRRVGYLVSERRRPMGVVCLFLADLASAVGFAPVQQRLRALLGVPAGARLRGQSCLLLCGAVRRTR
jgi:hypothetical protein